MPQVKFHGYRTEDKNVLSSDTDAETG